MHWIVLKITLKILPKVNKYFFSFYCIDVIIEFGELKLMPLETAFGYRKGSLDKIKVDGSVNERKCAPFAQVSQLLATLPSNIPPEVKFCIFLMAVKTTLYTL